MAAQPHMLLTGFDSFPSMPVNPCVEIVETLNEVWNGVNECEMTAVILNVGYTQAFESINHLIEQHQPAFILHLGVSNRVASVHLEQRAYNCRDASIPDVTGRYCIEEAIDKTFDRDHFIETQLNTDWLYQNLTAKGHRVEVSLDAGRYVCNSLYWASLSTLDIPVLFAHIPNTKPGQHQSTIACIHDLILSMNVQ